MSRYLLILLILLAGVTIAGGIYKWKDEQGRTIYADKPPPSKASQRVILPPQPPKEVLQRAVDKLKSQEVRGSYSRSQETMLCMAAKAGNLETVRLLLQSGVLPNSLDRDGRTPLMCASSAGNLEVMKFLLKNGADIHARQSSVNIIPPPIDTALMYAAKNGRSLATQLLLEHGSRVNEKGGYNFTALVYAVKEGRRHQSEYPATVQILLKNGANPNVRVKDRLQLTPLMLAIKNGNNEIARILLDGGANPNTSSTEGETSLMIAVKKRDIETVQLLLDNEADLSLKDKQGRTVIQFARMLAFPEIEQLLLTNETTRDTSTGSIAKEKAKTIFPQLRSVKRLWQVTLEKPIMVGGGPWLVNELVIYHTYKGYLIALAAKTGTKVWEVKTNSEYMSRPAFVEGVLYFGIEKSALLSRDSQLIALQLKTGKVIWEVPTSSVIGDELFVSDRAVYVLSGRDWYAIDRISGKVIWHLQADRASAYPPVISDSTALLTGLNNWRLLAVDAKSGHVKWQFGTSEPFTGGGQFLSEVQKFKTSAPYDLYKLGISICELFLEGRTESDILSSGFEQFYGKGFSVAMFAVARKTICPLGTTREQLRFLASMTERPKDQEMLAAPPTTYGAKVFFRVRIGMDAGAIYALDLESGRIIRRWHTSSGFGGSPVADDKVIYFMDRNNLMAVSISNGDMIWSLDLQYEMANKNSLVLVGNYLYVVSSQIIRIDRMTGMIKSRLPINRIIRPIKEPKGGQICGLGRDFLIKANLTTGNIVWVVRKKDITYGSITIACGDRGLYYYDKSIHQIYAIELLELGSSIN